MLFVTNSKLLNGIKTQDPITLTYLYRAVFPRVRKLIEKQGGGYDIANDIFQEAIILIYRKAKDKTLPTQLKVEEYIIGICKFIWKNEHRNEIKKFVDTQIDEDEILVSEDDVLKEYQLSRRKKLFYEHFNLLQGGCKEILMAYFRGENFIEIAKEFGLKSEEYARRKKYLCKEYLVKSIKGDPMYNKLIGEYDDELFETD